MLTGPSAATVAIYGTAETCSRRPAQACSAHSVRPDTAGSQRSGSHVVAAAHRQCVVPCQRTSPSPNHPSTIARAAYGTAETCSRRPAQACSAHSVRPDTAGSQRSGSHVVAAAHRQCVVPCQRTSPSPNHPSTIARAAYGTAETCSRRPAQPRHLHCELVTKIETRSTVPAHTLHSVDLCTKV